MLKLQELKKKQQQAKAAESTPTNPPATGTDGNADSQGGSNTYVLKRQNSKELAETRKQKSKENVFSLRRSGGAKKGKKKQNAAELRVHKGT